MREKSIFVRRLSDSDYRFILEQRCAEDMGYSVFVEVNQ